MKIFGLEVEASTSLDGDEFVILPVGYGLVELHGQQGIRCLSCGFATFNPEDIRRLYCGFCHVFHSHDIALLRKAAQ